MANPEHVEILKQGAEVWNEWREENPDVKILIEDAELKSINLAGVNLSGIGLSSVKFYDAELNDANFDESSLVGVNFKYSNLDYVRVTNAYLYECNINICPLYKAEFAYATIFNSYFRNTRLIEVNFSSAMIGACVFSNVVMYKNHLNDIAYRDPSTIGLDTLLLSKGQIPVSFLKGCGVPEAFISIIPEITEQAAGYFKCFLSHSTSDDDFCNPLKDDLEKKGVLVWKFSKDARMGRGVWEEIENPIMNYDKVLLVCSENSLQSGPVLREIERTLQREDREHRHILFPIRLDDYVFKGWEHPRKPDVIEKVIGDFRDWRNPDSYEASLKKLIEDLKASEE